MELPTNSRIPTGFDSVSDREAAMSISPFNVDTKILPFRADTLTLLFEDDALDKATNAMDPDVMSFEDVDEIERPPTIRDDNETVLTSLDELELPTNSRNPAGFDRVSDREAATSISPFNVDTKMSPCRADTTMLLFDEEEFERATNAMDPPVETPFEDVDEIERPPTVRDDNETVLTSLDKLDLPTNSRIPIGFDRVSDREAVTSISPFNVDTKMSPFRADTMTLLFEDDALDKATNAMDPDVMSFEDVDEIERPPTFRDDSEIIPPPPPPTNSRYPSGFDSVSDREAATSMLPFNADTRTSPFRADTRTLFRKNAFDRANSETAPPEIDRPPIVLFESITDPSRPMVNDEFEADAMRRLDADEMLI